MVKSTSSTAKTAGYHHGNLRITLIQSAIDIIHERGIQKLSIRDVAKRIGVSHTAPYRHFKNKKSLLTAIAIDGFNQLSNSIDHSNKPKSYGDEVEIYLYDFGRAYIRFAIENVELYKIMFGDLIENKTNDPALFQAYDAPFQTLIQYVKALQKKRDIDHAEAEITVLAGWSMLHGYSLFLIDNRRNHEVGSPQQIELILNRFLNVCREHQANQD